MTNRSIIKRIAAPGRNTGVIRNRDIPAYLFNEFLVGGIQDKGAPFEFQRQYLLALCHRIIVFINVPVVKLP